MLAEEFFGRDYREQSTIFLEEWNSKNIVHVRCVPGRGTLCVGRESLTSVSKFRRNNCLTKSPPNSAGNKSC